MRWREHVQCCCLALLCALGSNARGEVASPQRPIYAVLSLIGDTMSVVGFRETSGSRLDRNIVSVVPVPEPIFDRAALLAAEDALKALAPGASTRLVVPAGADAYAAQRKLLLGGKFAAPGWLAQTLQHQGATQLLLITKLKAPARLTVRDGKTGSGVLEGLGYYIDRVSEMIDGETQAIGTGYIAAFAYFELTLVDLADGTVRGSRRVTGSHIYTVTHNTKNFNPWDTLTAEEKVSELQALIRREVAAASPKLMNPPMNPAPPH